MPGNAEFTFYVADNSNMMAFIHHASVWNGIPILIYYHTRNLRMSYTDKSHDYKQKTKKSLHLIIYRAT